MLRLFGRDSTLGLLFGYDIFTNLVMLALICLSVFSWAVIIHKIKTLKKLGQAQRAFLEWFKYRQSYEDVLTEECRSRQCPGYAVLQEGLAMARRLSGPNRLPVPGDLLPNVQAAMEREIGDQVESLNQRLTSLATISHVSPLLGLLGTVWGIMIAFLDIKNYGSTNIYVVAPGIAEALVTTIGGLIVAIPAAMAYNHFTTRIRLLTGQLVNLASEFTGELRVAAARRQD